MNWKPISEAPEDTLILLRKDFPEFETPMIVVGEVITFNEERHILCRGPYEGVGRTFSSSCSPEKFTHYAEIGELE